MRDYFGGLVWDGTSRLDQWLVTYFHAEPTEYVLAVGPRWLISSVARIYQPGCQADHVLILEGPQGKQKSQALRTLPNDEFWFTDRLSHIGSKDAAIEIAGIQIVELAEMDALTKAASSTSKSFLTRRHDRFRPPWGKHPITLPRQCIFAATINPPAGGYLKDPTGARRFWPVSCHGMIDRDGIERDRDQLWAEAVARYRAGAKWVAGDAAIGSTRRRAAGAIQGRYFGKCLSRNGCGGGGASASPRCLNMRSALFRQARRTRRKYESPASSPN